MDYLPIPAGLGTQYPSVPFAATLKLDSSCLFAEFPERHGFRSSGQFKLDRPEAEIADFIQSWLFFGLISELSGEELDLSEFKWLDENGNTVVRLGRLRMFLQTAVLERWSSKSRARYHYLYHDNDPESAFDGPEEEDVRFQPDTGFEGQSRQKRRYLLTRIDCLNLARTSLTQIESDLLDLDNPAFDRIILSVRLLIQSLDPTPECPIPKDCQVTPPAARALRKIMLDNGWCIHHWDRVCQFHNLETSAYLSLIPRRGGPYITHSSCTEMVCSAWSMSNNGSPKHTTLGCECSMVGVPSDKVSSIIQEGNIPLISIHADGKNRLCLRLETWDG
jgi:hypothetical protein